MTRFRRVLTNGTLVLASLALALLAVEFGLRVQDRFNAHEAIAEPPSISPPPEGDGVSIPPALLGREKERRAVLTMPDSWKRTIIAVPGAAQAFLWQGAVHLMDNEGMRRTSPIPQKSGDLYRVLVVGDSITYGYGISHESTFVSLLNNWLNVDYRTEILNMGVSGAQSEDVLSLMKTHVGTLQPNLVIYAMCLNDFLPSGGGEYRYDYPFPLPDNAKAFFIKHTRTGALLADSYDAALRGLHLRRDFFDDILRDFGGFRERFQHDVKEMNSFVRAAGLPDVVALVLDQFPDYGGRGYHIAKVAENALEQAGMKVIPTEDYYRRYNRTAMNVSRWEGHPDEVANFIWATMVSQELRRRDDLQAFRRIK